MLNEPVNVTNYVYDAWNCIYEKTVDLSDSSETVVTYTWGMDLSGSMQGAGGVGGMLSTTIGSDTYYPVFDANGNITHYLDSNADFMASYTYDPFGGIYVQSGVLADVFSYKFSTKPQDDVSGLYYYGFRWYDVENGRFVGRDPIQEQGGYNLYGFVGNQTIAYVDLFGLRTYQVGPKQEPQVTFDEDYYYNPSATPKASDYFYWAFYGTGAGLFSLFGHAEDAVQAYRHYRNGNGVDYKVNYEKAYNEDSSIKQHVDYAIKEAQQEAERLYDETQTLSFSMYSDAENANGSYAATENWQKTLGGYMIWGDGDVEVNASSTSSQATGCFTMVININALDRYNFNRGESDMASGLPDDHNGRFVIFGWAHSFKAYGSLTREVKWVKGKIDTSTTVSDSDGRGRGRDRPRGR